ncbi:putative Sugar transporter 2 [Hibiscus syriacus]|uniref:Sugar transporter 2 n=1 Tax=Hibiscus syriacus TaxID=106335 RepID=A0A6A2ZIU4_HIBSY|nr:putative Sugar transporter 2 [Hibiscus syriacus]
MYSSPIIVFSIIYIRFYLKTKYPESQRLKKERSGERLSADGKLVNTSNKPLLRPQKSVRRNARKEVVEWDGKNREEKDVLFVRGTYDSLSSKTNFLEEDSKLIFDRLGSSSVERGDGSPNDGIGTDRALGDPNMVFDNETSKPRRVSGDTFQGSSGTGPGDGGVDGKLVVKKPEEACEARNKAKQDDQKNYMDLGLIGIHNAPPGQLAPILIAKHNNNGISSNLAEDESPMPGSAPPLFLPKRNSFDLPYDPQEEKPNLTADGFQQEFMAANQKEMFFCRHESFHRGPWFPYPTTQNPNDAEFNLYYRDEKRLVEGKSGHHRLSSSGVENDIDIVELDEEITDRLQFIYIRRQCHTPTFSIASDLQVEVSEVGSPPLTTDGTVSSGEGDSVMYDEDVDRDINFENEEQWGGPFNLSREEVNRERLRELNDIIEEESVEVASISPSEHEAKKSLNGTSSISSRIDITKNGASHPTYINCEAHQGSSKCRHGNLETSYEVKSIKESGKKVEESQPSKYIEEDTRTLTEHNTRDAPSAVQSIGNLKSVPDTKVDQDAAENNTLERRLRDSIARALNRRLILEKVSVSSSSSPRSVLQKNILACPVPISGGGRRMQRSLSHYVREDRVRSNFAYEQAHEKLTANMPYMAHELVENSINQLTRNRSLETMEAHEFKYKNKFVGMEKMLLHFPSTFAIFFCAYPFHCHPLGPGFVWESNLSSTEHLEGRLEKIIYYDTRIEPLKSDYPKAIMGPWNIIEESNIVLNINNSAGIGKGKGKELSASEGESLFLIRPEDASGSEKSNEQEADINETETIESDYTRIVGSAKEKEKANEGESLLLVRPEDISEPEKSNEQEAGMNETETIEYTSIVESAKEREEVNAPMLISDDYKSGIKYRCLEISLATAFTINSAAEVDRICKANEPVVDNVTNKEIKNDVLEHEGALQILGKLEAVIETSNTTRETSAVSVEDTEHESKRLAEAEATAGQATLARETDSLNNINNDAKMQNLIGQEGVMDTSESGEDDLKVIESVLKVDSITKGISIDHDITVKVSKLMESEVKASKMIKHDTGIDPSESEKDNAKSDDIETLEPTNYPRKIVKEGNIVTTINDLAVTDKEGEKFTANKGQSQFSIRQEGIGGFERLNEMEADVNKPEAIENDYTNIVETAIERQFQTCDLAILNGQKVMLRIHPLLALSLNLSQNSAAKVDHICKANESVADNVTNKEINKDVLEREGALRILNRLESFIEPSNTTGKISEGSVEDTEHKSKRLAEAEANSILSTSASETNSSNNIKNGQEVQNMTHQEGIEDASQS